MGVKYIRNTDDATIVCKIPSDKNKTFIFRPKKIDKRNNIVLSNGFTEITEEDLELLRKESSTFMYYEKAKKLTLADKLPYEAMSSEQLISILRNENEQLKLQLAADKDTAALTEAQNALQNALMEIEKLTGELKEASEKAEEQERMIAGLDEHLAAVTQEMLAVSSDEEKE